MEYVVNNKAHIRINKMNHCCPIKNMTSHTGLKYCCAIFCYKYMIPDGIWLCSYLNPKRGEKYIANKALPKSKPSMWLHIIKPQQANINKIIFLVGHYLK